MRARIELILTAAVFVAIATTVASQNLETKPNSNPNPLKINAPGCSDTGSARAPEPPQPYYLELKTTTVQTLANGATITTEGSEIQARDSEGRTMSGHTMSFPGSDGMQEETLFRVSDPVENTEINWDSQRKEARVLKLPPKEDRHGCWRSESGMMSMNYGPFTPPIHPATTPMPLRVQTQMEEPKMEDLGTSTIEGLEVHGRRTTTVIPAGQIGNDQPLVRTMDEWFSPGIPVQLRRIVDDPQSGKSTTEVVKLDLSDPPLETFQPPEGYTVKVEELHQVECSQQ